MSVNLNKGNALEEAVEAIENFLISRNKWSTQVSIIMQRKKIVIHEGVIHEIDLYIEIDLGNGYKVINIFECKNWEEAINKNEIIIFSEKIKCVNAQKGYFIAKSFSKYAEAQALKDERIELLIATEEFKDFPLHKLPNMHSSIINYIKINLFENLELPSIEWKPESYIATANGNKIQLNTYFTKEVDDFILNKYVHFGQIKLEEQNIGSFSVTSDEIEGLEPGTHEFNNEIDRELNDEEVLVVNGIKIVAVRLFFNHTMKVIEPIIVWKFDVHTRAKIIALEWNTPVGLYSAKLTGVKEGEFHVNIQRSDT